MLGSITIFGDYDFFFFFFYGSPTGEACGQG
jgi:hypothetical protein